MGKEQKSNMPSEDRLTSQATVEGAEAVVQHMTNVRDHVGTLIFGQQEVLDQALISLMSGGHVLLVGVPGLAKTRLTQILGVVLGLSERRVQFTPDLMPADILGSEVLEESDAGRRSFRFIEGPVFSQLLMADEINRASPRTQSALLQAMQEQEITVAGKTHSLPKPFHVIATQNPIEQEGTYPLPEAQLDRFIMQVNIDYPDLDDEKTMLVETTTGDDKSAKEIITARDLQSVQELVRTIPVGDHIVDSILRLVRSGRPMTSGIPLVVDSVSWGPGPRAGQSLMLATRARALLDGRLSPSMDDVLALAAPVLRHRMHVTFAARAEGISLDQVIKEMCAGLA